MFSIYCVHCSFHIDIKWLILKQKWPNCFIVKITWPATMTIHPGQSRSYLTCSKGFNFSYFFWRDKVAYNIRCVIVRMGAGKYLAQSLASLSTKRVVRVRARLHLFVTERRNPITVLLTHSHQYRWLVKKRPSMCYYVCVIMHVKDP